MAVAQHELPPTRTPEPAQTPEREGFMPRQEAFQARVLAVTAGGNRELLNPNQPVPLLTPDALGSLEPSDFTVIKDASLAERNHYWTTQRSEVAEDARYDTWLTDTKAAFDSGQRFFGTRKGEQWIALFDKLDIQALGFSDTNQQAENLYNKYFSEDDTENVDRFIENVITVHMDPQGNFDRTTFEQNRDAIQWLANLFGEKSAQVMTQIADGQTRPTQELAAAANQRRNPDQLTDKEAELLEFLYDPQDTLQRAVTPTPPTQRRTQNQPPPPTPIAPIRVRPVDDQPAAPRPTTRQPIRTIVRPQPPITIAPEPTTPDGPEPIRTITRPTPIRVASPTSPPDVQTDIPTPAGPPEPIDEQPTAPVPEPQITVVSSVDDSPRRRVTNPRPITAPVSLDIPVASPPEPATPPFEPTIPTAPTNDTVAVTEPTAEPDSAAIAPTSEHIETPEDRFRNNLNRFETTGEHMTASEAVVPLTELLLQVPGIQVTEAIVRENQANIRISDISIAIDIGEGETRRTLTVYYPTTKQPAMISIKMPDSADNIQTSSNLEFSENGEIKRGWVQLTELKTLGEPTTILEFDPTGKIVDRHGENSMFYRHIPQVDIPNIFRTITDVSQPYTSINIDDLLKNRTPEPPTPPEPTTDALDATAPTPSPEGAATPGETLTLTDPAAFTETLTSLRDQANIFNTALEELDFDTLRTLRANAIPEVARLLKTIPGISVDEDSLRDNQENYPIVLNESHLEVPLNRNIVALLEYGTTRPHRFCISRGDSGTTTETVTFDITSAGVIQKGYINISLRNPEYRNRGDRLVFTGDIVFDGQGKSTESIIDPELGTLTSADPQLDIPAVLHALTTNPTEKIDIYDVFPLQAPTSPDRSSDEAENVSTPSPDRLEIADKEAFQRDLQELAQFSQRYGTKTQLVTLDDHTIQLLSNTFNALPGISITENGLRVYADETIVAKDYYSSLLKKDAYNSRFTGSLMLQEGERTLPGGYIFSLTPNKQRYPDQKSLKIHIAFKSDGKIPYGQIMIGSHSIDFDAFGNVEADSTRGTDYEEITHINIPHVLAKLTDPITDIWSVDYKALLKA